MVVVDQACLDFHFIHVVGLRDRDFEVASLYEGLAVHWVQALLHHFPHALVAHALLLVFEHEEPLGQVALNLLRVVHDWRKPGQLSLLGTRCPFVLAELKGVR